MRGQRAPASILTLLSSCERTLDFMRTPRRTGRAGGDRRFSSLRVRRTWCDPYWKQITGKRQPAYYSFSIAGWQILSLKSEDRHGRRSAQVRWLRRQVRRPGTCRLAFWHRPRYSAGTQHGEQEDVAPFWSALKGRARIVVNGHEHDMQRHEVRDGITVTDAGLTLDFRHDHLSTAVEIWPRGRENVKRCASREGEGRSRSSSRSPRSCPPARRKTVVRRLLIRSRPRPSRPRGRRT